MPPNIRQRVRDAAEFVLKQNKSVGPIELLNQLGFLHYSHVQQWQRGNPYYDSLLPHVQCGEKKLNQTWEEFLAWAKEKNLEPFTAEYSSANRNGTTSLKISPAGDQQQDVFFKTHFRSANLTEKQKERIEKKNNKAPDLVVFESVGDGSDCSECSQKIEQGELFFLERQQPLCLQCADLDHLEFLPSGDATLTRRSRKHSPLSAIVMRFNRRRKRHQRTGVLVATAAIEFAHAQNEGDAEQRARLRERAALQRDKQDVKLVEQVKALILDDFPGCSPDVAGQIANHTAKRGSGRVGRSAAGRNLDPGAVKLAVIAWIRHQHTDYDQLLMSGVERQTARDQIRDVQQEVINRWRKN